MFVAKQDSWTDGMHIRFIQSNNLQHIHVKYSKKSHCIVLFTNSIKGLRKGLKGH